MTLSLLPLYTASILFSSCSIVFAAPPQNLDDAKQAVTQVLSEIHTVKMEADITLVPAIDEIKFYQTLGTVPGLKGKMSATYSSNGYFRIETSNANEMSSVEYASDRPNDFKKTTVRQFEKIRDEVKVKWEKRGMSPPTRIVVNGPDGLFQTRPAGPESHKLPPAFEKLVSEHIELGFLPDNPISDLLLFLGWQTVETAESEFATEAKPLTLDWSNASVSGFELAGDCMLMILSLDGGAEVFLDTDHGMAVRKRTWKFRNMIVQELNADALTEVADGVYLPSRVAYTTYGHSDFHGEDQHGKSLYNLEYDNIKWSLNRAEHQSDFRIEIPAGATVIDNTILKIQQSIAGSFGEPSQSNVGYIQPADKADLEAVVIAATDEAIARNVASSTKTRATSKVFLTFFVAGVLVSAFIVFFVKFRRRHS